MFLLVELVSKKGCVVCIGVGARIRLTRIASSELSFGPIVSVVTDEYIGAESMLINVRTPSTMVRRSKGWVRNFGSIIGESFGLED
jgi:hypothetical protein